METLHSALVGCLIGLARATEGNDHLLTEETARIVADGLTCTDGEAAMLDRIDREKRRLVPMCYECASPCGRTNAYDLRKLQTQPEAVRNSRLRILSALRAKARRCPAELLYRALFAVGMEDWGEEELLPIEESLERL